MAIYLSVPFVSQVNFGAGMNDPTGCWYSSACMLAYVDAAGPRLGVPELHTGTHDAVVGQALAVNGHAAIGSPEAVMMLSLKSGSVPASPEDCGLRQLCENEGLVPVNTTRATNGYTAGELETMVRTYGPVMFFWTKSFSAGRAGRVSPYGHASVLIGVTDEGYVTYHDPESGRDLKMTLAAFNSSLQTHAHALLRRRDRSSA